uniref:Uncharacterized protein n=1 Tax=Oryza barthii TaxID=65489 RepID=A0A0D3GZ53_9ORYZ
MGQKLWLANWHIAQEHNLRRDRVTSWLSDDFVNVGTHVFILHTGTGAHCRKKREVDFRTDRLPRAQMPSSVLLRSPSNRASLDPLDSGGRQAVGDGSAPPAECVGEARLRIAGRKLHRTEVLHSSKGLRPLT